MMMAGGRDADTIKTAKETQRELNQPLENIHILDYTKDAPQLENTEL